MQEWGVERRNADGRVRPLIAIQKTQPTTNTLFCECFPPHVCPEPVVVKWSTFSATKWLEKIYAFPYLVATLHAAGDFSVPARLVRLLLLLNTFREHIHQVIEYPLLPEQLPPA